MFDSNFSLEKAKARVDYDFNTEELGGISDIRGLALSDYATPDIRAEDMDMYSAMFELVKYFMVGVVILVIVGIVVGIMAGVYKHSTNRDTWYCKRDRLHWFNTFSGLYGSKK